jgi:hypothetical protein
LGTLCGRDPIRNLYDGRLQEVGLLGPLRRQTLGLGFVAVAQAKGQTALELEIAG